MFKRWLICFTFTRGSILVKYFNEEILKLRQEGILHLLSERYFHRDGDSGQDCSLSRTSVSLTFDHVFTPFSLLAMGLFTGIFFGIVEKLFGFSKVQSVNAPSKFRYDRFQKVKTAEALLSVNSLGYEKKFELLKGLFSDSISGDITNKGA